MDDAFPHSTSVFANEKEIGFLDYVRNGEFFNSVTVETKSIISFNR